MWMLFFSLLCATASAFQYSHLTKDLEVFVTNCTDNPRSCSARVDEMRVLKLFVFFVPTMFSGILGSFVENSTVVSFPFLVCTQTYLEVCVVERIVARSGLVSRVLLAFSISLCALLFLEPLFARVGNYLFFRVHGSTRFVSSSLSYVAVCHARVKNNRDKPLLDVIIIVFLCHYH